MTIKTTYHDLDAAKAKIEELIEYEQAAMQRASRKYQIAAHYCKADGLALALRIINSIEPIEQNLTTNKEQT